MRLIDAEALKTKIQILLCEVQKHGFTPPEQIVNLGLLLQYIDNAPTIEAKPVVHAHWAKDEEFPTCSNCKAFMADKNALLTPYCPCCGAQMDEVVDEENAKTTDHFREVTKLIGDD